MVIFDIPESTKEKRQQIRNLLREKRFVKLQASVYIHPFPFNQEAVEYLKISKLIDYIRILRVDKIDFDKELKKKFKLK